MPNPALPRVRRPVLAGVLITAVVAGAVMLARAWRRSTPEETRIAVAVFVNRTGDPTLEPLGSMAADWVTRGLTHTALVDVVDVGAVYVQGRSPEGSPTDPYELARRNGAGTVVSGSYYLATDTLVIRATVEDAATMTVLQRVAPVHVPAGQAVRALDQLREHVMTAIAGVFDVRYGSVTGRQSAPLSLSAYRAFVDGQTAYWQGRPPPEVKAFFERAAAEDTSFLVPAVWLAFVGANGAGCGLTDSVAAAMQSRRDQLSPFDRLTLDISSARCRNDWDAGYRLALEQSRLKPRSSYAVYTAGFFALTSGHIRAARDLLVSIDPDRDLGWLSDSAKTPYWRDLTSAQHLLGDYAAELQHAERQIREFPTRLAPRLTAARALAALGRADEALQQVSAAAKLEFDPTIRLGGGLTPGVACYLAAAELRVHGDSAAGETAAQQAVDWYRADPARLDAGRFERYHMARALVLLGRLDEAVATLAFRGGADTTEPLHAGLRGVVAARLGRREAALVEDQRLVRIGESQPSNMTAGMQRARIAIALGDLLTAIELFERAAARGLVRVAFGHDFHSDPLFDPLRGQPRFERINRAE